MYIMDTFGEQCFGLYTEVVLYINYSFGTWVPGRYNYSNCMAFIQRCMVVNRGSTVHAVHIQINL